MEFSKARLAARLVLSAIAHRVSNDNGEAFPSIPTLCHETLCDERTVQRSIRALIDMGELEIIEQGGRGKFTKNHYRMPLFAEWEKGLRKDGTDTPANCPPKKSLPRHPVRFTPASCPKSGSVSNYRIIIEQSRKPPLTPPAGGSNTFPFECAEGLVVVQVPIGRRLFRNGEQEKLYTRAEDAYRQLHAAPLVDFFKLKGFQVEFTEKPTEVQRAQ